MGPRCIAGRLRPIRCPPPTDVSSACSAASANTAMIGRWTVATSAVLCTPIMISRRSPQSWALSAHAMPTALVQVARIQPSPGAADPSRPRHLVGLEYACHVRDVLLAQRERLFLTLVEDCPSFVPIYRDQRAALARYGSEDPLRVTAEIDMAASLISRAFSGLESSHWSRRCKYNFPTPWERTVGWLGQHTLHEAEHHLRDISTVISNERRANW